MRPNHVQGRIHLQKLRFREIWPQDDEKDNSPKWIGWMEARWMGFSFWLNIYHSWYLPWRQKQALFLTWKRASEKATGTVANFECCCVGLLPFWRGYWSLIRLARPTISRELDWDPDSDASRGLAKKNLKTESETSPTYPLKSCLARILGRMFFQVISSNETQQKHWKGRCPNPAKMLKNAL